MAKTINLNTFCAQLLQGDLDNQLADLRETAEAQKAYSHPLKMKTASDQNKLGAFNEKAADILEQLKSHLLTGNQI